MARESRIDEACGGVGEQAEAAERALALEPCGDIVGEGHLLVGGAQHKLAGVQDKRLVGHHFDQAGQVWLVFGRVDDRVLVVVEKPKISVDAHVNTRRLNHARVIRIEGDAAVIDCGANVTV